MEKIPLTLDWNDLLSSKDNEAPPPEVEVVTSNAVPLLAHLTDQQISDRVQRIRSMDSRVRDSLPDKGAKLRTSLQQLQAEVDRRKLVKSLKVWSWAMSSGEIAESEGFWVLFNGKG